MRVKGLLLKIFLPLFIILLGVIGLRVMITSRQAPQKAARENPGALVKVMTVRSEDRRVKVVGTGTVQPSREVAVTPQVSGKVVRISPSLVTGGFFSQGDILFEIEQSDYLLAVERAGAALAKAEVDLATVQGQAEVARQEWERLSLGGPPPSPLVLYEPQMKNAAAAVTAARAVLEQARLDLERTRLYAPFNCRVRSEQVEVGQYVRAGTSVAVVAGTDLAEVVVPLPPEELRWLTVGKSGGTVSFADGNDVDVYRGRLVRSYGEADAKSRLIPVVVVVDDPYALKGDGTGRRSLDVGSFVTVTLEGRLLSGVTVIPREALRTGDTVWIVDEEDRLRIRTVEVLRRERDEILLAEGLSPGERIVLTTISGSADGMKLRPKEEGR